ncbi:MAG TPA: hypothetical protein VJ249_03655 [Candidatus Bathyarchaeia archaeon]|nr:hypothetical protein [Candidatus Bathyarchaeia archaeon]
MVHRQLGQGTSNERRNIIIDNVLIRMLGREATKTIYHHLENTHAVQKQQIAQEMDSFNVALRECLGSGAMIIEQTIRKNMELDELEDETSLPGKTRILKLI